MAAVDEWIEPVEILTSLLDAVEDVQLLVVELLATGRIETGIANTGDPVEIIGMGAEN
jgi:elongation factor Tu